ncbi:MAG: hypothetical protein B7Y84_10745 [Azorhizobium sp. 32-67-21]|nr:MAG: hypothetical protein B7Y84_10745 [Azorhizobium sp. 32-67-21]
MSRGSAVIGHLPSVSRKDAMVWSTSRQDYFMGRMPEIRSCQEIGHVASIGCDTGTIFPAGRCGLNPCHRKAIDRPVTGGKTGVEGVESMAPDMVQDGADGEERRRRLRTSALPLYVALSNLIRAEIEEGRWPPGHQLPTLDQLSEMYGVARVTVRQALGVLADDRLIERMQGKGTFVADRLTPRKIIQLDSSWHTFMEMLDGNLPETLAVEVDVPLPGVREGEGQAAASYRYMRRVHSAGNQPYCVIEVYLDTDAYRRAPEAFDTAMVIPLLGRLPELRVKKMAQSVRILAADLTVARLLDLPVGAPVGEVRRVITDRDGRILYLGTGQYRGDLVVFNTTLEVPPD